ncbi:unnamed protein product [Calicophoron daubneyi]|uniref:Trematode PH-like domain-containing protein n=1 Tax=Calicophoron daubneyi TaxID=300641 RepID=A0AAV2TGV3_CALDB
MPRRSRRASYRRRSSQYMNGELADAQTNQKLYQTIPLCTCYRYTLGEQEEFSEAKARRVLESWHQVRQAHCNANLLEDRITLQRDSPDGKEPFRSWLDYSEIQDFQRYSKKPEYFVLSIRSHSSGRRFYEVYKCKNTQDADIFERTVRRAMADPEHRLHGENALATVKVRDDPSHTRSLSHLEFQTSLESLDRDFPECSYYEQNSPTPPEGYDYVEDNQPSPLPQPVHKETYVRSAPSQSSPPPPTVRSPSPTRAGIVMIQIPSSENREPTPAFTGPPATISASPPRLRTPSPVPVVRSVTPVRAQPVSSSQVKPTGTEGVTYIEFDPRTQNPTVANNGPVYMYAYREDDSRSLNDYGNNPLTRIGNSTTAY